jgi:hypothetical protein
MLINIFSKCMTDIEYRLYEHSKDEKGRVVESRIKSRIVIKGRNTSYRNSGIITDTAMTSVDKDLWEAIQKDYGLCDQMLISGQIFMAKSNEEASKMAKDTARNISEFETRDSMLEKAKKTSQQKKLV